MIAMSLRLDETLTLYLLGDESALFSTRSRQLYGLDRTATAAVMRLRQGEDPEAVSRAMGLKDDRSGMVYGLAALLAGEEVHAGEEYRTDLPCSRQVPGHGEGLTRYRLLETVFALEGPEELIREWFLPYVAHLKTGMGGPIHLLASIEAEGTCWRLRLNGTPQDEALPPERLLPVFYSRLRPFAYQSRPYLLSVHGAVVTGGGNTLVLAGQSGTGKSTLAAGLLAGGYRLLSDEPAVIDPSGREVLSMPLALGLKAGSWPAALCDYPGLESLPVHVRFDGQPIRYLLPGAIHLAAKDTGHPATHLVFPSYSPDVSGRTELLSPVQALRAITEAGYQVPGLDEERVERILQWITGMTCFTLAYASSTEALALIEEIIEGTRSHERARPFSAP